MIFYMASLIPQIKISSRKKRDKVDLSFDNSTTLGFGHIQPTMCREMIPGSNFKVKVGSFVRLSPLVLPTFGRMSLVHKHVFVPISSLWEPFDSFLAGQPYVGEGVSSIFTKTPYFNLAAAVQHIITNYSDVTIYTPNPDPTTGNPWIPVSMNPVEYSSFNGSISTANEETNRIPTYDYAAYQTALAAVYNEAQTKYANGDFGTVGTDEAIAAKSAWIDSHHPSMDDYVTWSISTSVVPDSAYSFSVPGNVPTGFDPDISGIQQAWTDLVVGGADLFGNATTVSLFNLSSSTNPTGIANDGLGTILLGGYYIEASKTSTLLSIRTESNLVGNVVPVGDTVSGSIPASELGLIDYRNCDFFTEITKGGRTYGIAFRLKPVAKRIRSIFIGLGYQFNPFNTNDFSPFKLLAFYKAWFDLFRPKRELSFSQTNAYKVMLGTRKATALSLTGGVLAANWNAFLVDLGECYYYLPQDYFGMSVLRPMDNYQTNGASSPTPLNVRLSSFDGDVLTASQTGIPTDGSAPEMRATNRGNNPALPGGYAVTIPVQNPAQPNATNFSGISAQAVQMALKMLKFVNKNTVVGRSVYDYLKAHFGISVDDADGTGKIIFIGDDDIQIQISDVMSTAATSEARIGEYAGKGIGYGDSNNYDFTAKEFGYWITLSAIIPKSGYFQGYLRENRHLERFDFFHPEFDALGYQILERGEVMDDYTHKFASFNPVEGQGYTRKAGFGFVPRYSEYKVGRNIVNGDMSLNSLDNSMAGYYLDRRFPRFDENAYSYEDANQVVHPLYQLAAPSFKPSIVFDNFRRIDPSDRLGNYGRIFAGDAVMLDPFIVHNVFKVDSYLPAKSLSESFDTIESDETGVTEITHS